MKNKVTVSIYGRTYQMLSSEDQDYTDRIADALNQRMAKLREAKPSISVQDAAAVISLECFDELVGNKQTEQNLRTQVTAYAEEADGLRTEKEALEQENAKLKERIRQLESEIRLRMQFAGDESTAEQIVKSSITKALGAPPKK
jgi:cell division protein ZapA